VTNPDTPEGVEEEEFQLERGQLAALGHHFTDGSQCEKCGAWWHEVLMTGDHCDV
jgi:hypothetical protein